MNNTDLCCLGGLQALPESRSGSKGLDTEMGG